MVNNNNNNNKMRTDEATEIDYSAVVQFHVREGALQLSNNCGHHISLSTTIRCTYWLPCLHV